jgi:hypothetical protein
MHNTCRGRGVDLGLVAWVSHLQRLHPGGTAHPPQKVVYRQLGHVLGIAWCVEHRASHTRVRDAILRPRRRRFSLLGSWESEVAQAH